MNIKKTIIAFGAIMMACGASAAEKSEKMVTRDVTVSEFTEISAYDGIQVNYTPSLTHSVTVTAPASVIDNVDVYVIGSELSIDLDSDIVLTGDNKIVVDVKCTGIDALSAEDAAKITVLGDINVSGDFEIEASTSGTVTFRTISARYMDISADTSAKITGTIKTGVIDIEAETAAKIKLKGNCDSVSAEASSGSCIDLGDLKAKTGDLEVDSAAKIISPTGGKYKKFAESAGQII